MNGANEFASWARLAVDILICLWAVSVVMMAALYSGGQTHTTPGTWKVVSVLINAAAVVAWLIWRPTF